MSRLPRDRQAQPRDDRPDHAADGGYVGTLGALAHPRVFASGAVIGLFALPDEALDIGLPVWIAATHREQFWLVGGALILNTMFVVGCQVPVARWLDRMSMTTNCYCGRIPRRGFRAARDHWLTGPRRGTARPVQRRPSCAEICGSVVNWEMSYSQQQRREAEFQAAFSLGSSSHQLVGGVLFSDPIAAFGSLDGSWPASPRSSSPASTAITAPAG